MYDYTIARINVQQVNTCIYQIIHIPTRIWKMIALYSIIIHLVLRVLICIYQKKMDDIGSSKSPINSIITIGKIFQMIVFMINIIVSYEQRIMVNILSWPIGDYLHGYYYEFSDDHHGDYVQYTYICICMYIIFLCSYDSHPICL